MPVKTDKSIKNICIAAVKRHTIPPIDFPYSTLFDNDGIDVSVSIALADHELPIAKTHIDALNWTLVTTRRIITCLSGLMQELPAARIKSYHWGDFKGMGKKPFTIGEIQSEEGDTINIHIETGRASMVIIYSIRTVAGMEWKLP